MMRRRHGVSLSRPAQAEEDVNPNAYLVNIADCMLVLLLGVIVALVSYYNVDLAQSGSEEPGDAGLTGIQVDMDQDEDGAIDPGYQKRGTVYYDEANDSYYFVTD